MYFYVYIYEIIKLDYVHFSVAVQYVCLYVTKWG